MPLRMMHLSEPDNNDAGWAGDNWPALPDLPGSLQRRNDLSEVARAVEAISKEVSPVPWSRSVVPGDNYLSGLDISLLNQPGRPSGRPGWLASNGLSRVDLCELIPVEGHVSPAFLLWLRRMEQDLTEQLDLVRSCSLTERGR